MNSFPKNKSLFILQSATVCVFAGRAYQHLFKDAPYREIIWDPKYTGSLVSFFTDLTWGEFVTHPLGDLYIQKMIWGIGLFYLAISIYTVFIKKTRGWGRGLLLTGASGLIVLAAVYTKDHFFHIGQFFEYTLQFGSPIFLYYYLKKGGTNQAFVFLVKTAIVLTFICHGLYATGYYPYPAVFMTMTGNLLGLSGQSAIRFLNIMGIMDFIMAIGIFLPNKYGKWALMYCVVWGFLTSMARVFGNFYWEYPMESLHQWVYEAVYRAPHFLIPLWAWFDGSPVPSTSR